MKKLRALKSWSKRNLPDHLWPEIFSRLPVKALLQFRSVSKSWRALIDNHEFARLHLTRFNNNRHGSHLFVSEGELWNHCVVRCSRTFRTNARLGSLKNAKMSIYTLRNFPGIRCDLKWAVLCSTDGVIMLRNGSIVPAPDLMLWNPSIRKARTLPPSPEVSDGIRNVDLGLGFDPLIKDYKLVRLVFLEKISVHSVAIYTVKIDSWRTIQFKGKGCPCWRWFDPFYHQMAPLCLRGVIYFLKRCQGLLMETDGLLELVSFDLSSELFSFTVLPVDSKMEASLAVADGGCSLAVVNFWGAEGSVWVMESSLGADNESMNWIKRYTFASRISELDTHCGRFLYLKMDGEILLKRKKGMVITYNLETQKEEIVLKRSCSWGTGNVWGYMESLTLLN